MSILWIQEHETSFHFLLSPSSSSFNALDFSLQQSCSLCQDCVCVRFLDFPVLSACFLLKSYGTLCLFCCKYSS